MGFWTEADLSLYYCLARTFPVADRWFCSCLGPTFPNRRLPDRGHRAHGLDRRPAMGPDRLSGDGNDLRPTQHARHLLGELPQRQSGNRHHQAGARHARSHRAATSWPGIGRWLPGVLNAERGNKSFTADLYPLGLARYHLGTPGPRQRFFADAAAGTLPAVSIVDPDFGAYSEENPQDISHWRSPTAPGQRRPARTRRGNPRCCCGSTTSTAATTTTCRPRLRPCRQTTCPRTLAAMSSRHGCASRFSRLTAKSLANPSRTRTPAPPTYDRLRVPDSRRDRVAVRAARASCFSEGARSDVGAEADQGEVQPAAADPPGCGGALVDWRPQPRRPAGVPEPAGVAAWR